MLKEPNKKQKEIITFAADRISALDNYTEQTNAVKLFTTIADGYDVKNIENEVLNRALNRFINVFEADFNNDSFNDYNLNGLCNLIEIIKSERPNENESYKVFKRVLNVVKENYNNRHYTALMAFLNNYPSLPIKAQDELEEVFLLIDRGNLSGFELKYEDAKECFDNVVLDKKLIEFVFPVFYNITSENLIAQKKKLTRLRKDFKIIDEENVEEKSKVQSEITEVEESFIKNTNYFLSLLKGVLVFGVDDDYIEIAKGWSNNSPIKSIDFHQSLDESEFIIDAKMKILLAKMFMEAELKGLAHFTKVLSYIYEGIYANSKKVPIDFKSETIDYLAVELVNANYSISNESDVTSEIIKLSDVLLTSKNKIENDNLLSSILYIVDLYEEPSFYNDCIIEWWPQFSKKVTQETIKEEIKKVNIFFLEYSEEFVSRSEKLSKNAFLYGLTLFENCNSFEKGDYSWDDVDEKSVMFGQNINNYSNEFYLEFEKFILLIERLVMIDSPMQNKDFYIKQLGSSNGSVRLDRLSILNLCNMIDNIGNNELDIIYEKLLASINNIEEIDRRMATLELMVNCCTQFELVTFWGVTKSSGFNYSQLANNKTARKLISLIFKEVIEVPKNKRNLSAYLSHIGVINSYFENNKLINARIIKFLSKEFERKTSDRPDRLKIILNSMVTHYTSSSYFNKTELRKLFNSIADKYKSTRKPITKLADRYGVRILKKYRV